MPCRLACYLKQSCFNVSSTEADFLWSGVTEGFKIIDGECSTTYECGNYKSILEKQFYGEYCEMLKDEISQGLVTELDQKPLCIHSLGGGGEE